MTRILVTGATVAAFAWACSGAPAEAAITSCGRVSDTHYSFRVVAHGQSAPSCRRARHVARRAVGDQIGRPFSLPGWSCTGDYYYEGPWSFLCIRRRTHSEVSIDGFRRLPKHLSRGLQSWMPKPLLSRSCSYSPVQDH